MKYTDIEKRADTGEHCFLFRDAIRNNWINRQHEVNRTGLWMVAYIEDRKTQLEAFMCEALACALYHDDRAIAIRACFQATGYQERLRSSFGWAGGGYYEDALRRAQRRAECWATNEALP